MDTQETNNQAGEFDSNSNPEATFQLEAPLHRASTSFLVVGVGASAGGLDAIERFFDHIPAEKPNIAFVVVTHLSPEHKSNMAALIQNHSALPVIQVNEAIVVKPDTIYVIPPGKQLSMDDGQIRLADIEKNRADRAPIDLFFRTLAETHTDWAVGVLLSGTGSDGSVGLPRIKENGGLTIVQLPEEAQYSQMPRNAIATGFIDQILPVEEMGRWLVNYNENRQAIKVSTALTLPPPNETVPADHDTVVVKGDTLLEILALLRVRTGHNFALYKRSTLNRRIERRMQVNDLSDLTGYLAFLGTHPSEVQALMRDLLISVTNFFRDREVWDFLESNVIPSLFNGKDTADSTVRVWVAGCATGEEAYSVAILLHEYASRLLHIPKLQVFATDLDEQAIAIAREGSYPETIGLDVSPERLRQFFTHNGRRYRVRKEIRETILFAAHDLLKDPPFSRLDMVSCRNLLIYLNREAQEQLLTLFHFALKPEGFLLLGTSESAEGSPLLFTSSDKKQHLYTRRTLPRFYQPVPVLPVVEQLEIARTSGLTLFPAIPMPPRIKERTVLPTDLHQNILEMYGPPSVVVDENFDIVHMSNTAGRYLQFRGGEPTINLLRLVHPDLRLDLRSGLYTAVQGTKANETRRIRLSIEGAERLVRLIVRLIKEPPTLQGYILVMFDEIDESAEKDGTVPESSEVSRANGFTPADDSQDLFAHQLEEENEVLKIQLRTTIEQYETSLEELKASNEELQAINEELRSATEELETSREELQAVNEELLTVNQELKIKVEEVSHVNSDLQNLMVSTDLATIFLNRQLRIKRYTPKVEQLFNIIASDIDRPLSHLTHRLQYNELAGDIEKVLRDLTPIAREVATHNGEWYLARVLPYRTLEDRIDGVVLTFTDITERRLSEDANNTSHKLVFDILEMLDAAFFTLDDQENFTYLNRQAEQSWNRRREDLLGKNIWAEFPRAAATTPYTEIRQAIRERTQIQLESTSLFTNEGWFEIRVLPSENGVSVYIKEITARRKAE